MRIELPENVRYIIRELENAGYEAYAVGGCVRDSILGRKPEDWDITTSALPEEVKSVFRYTVDTGIEHGTVTVKIKNRPGTSAHDVDAYEVTTYRVDGEYEDMRHPKSVSFTRSLEEDLKRRDFTVNAMAYNEKNGLTDLFGGICDLNGKVIRCVGSPDDRLEEDALRMLRAVRFSAQLDFSVEEATKHAISTHAENLKAVSKERIFTEISKLICSAHIEKTEDVIRLGLAEYIASGFKDAVYNELFSGKKYFGKFAGSIPLSERYERYAVLFAGQKADTVKRILKELKSDNDTKDRAAALSERIFKKLPEDRFELKCRMAELSPGLFRKLLEIKMAFGEEGLERVMALYEDIIKKQEPVYIKDLAITGQELIKAGIKEGPEIGRTLSRLMDEVRKHPEKNNAETLLAMIGSISEKC